MNDIKGNSIAILAGAEVRKAILSIQNRGRKLDGDIQSAGLQCLLHADQHGDTTLLDALFNAMPKGSRRVLLAEWAINFGTVRALDPKSAEDKARIDAGAHFRLDRSRTLDIEGAVGTAWFDMKPQQAAHEAFDAAKAVQQLIKRLEKASGSAKGLDEAAMAMRSLQAAITAAQDAREAREAAE